MTVTLFGGRGVGAGFGVGCGFGIGFGFGGAPLSTLGLGVGGGCGVGLGVGWGFGFAYGARYIDSRPRFQGMTFQSLAHSNDEDNDETVQQKAVVLHQGKELR
eukprot:TRINITY_DN901_c0_g1_i2.p5 TRINITY_DN901_c0_g1~~TRINITY_DN901_c0_g1_i2.p5  ORF type:complete len:103 (-),score=6.44 TRINITY_DN901_c0_g1_i2:894-1202(-)